MRQLEREDRKRKILQDKLNKEEAAKKERQRRAREARIRRLKAENERLARRRVAKAKAAQRKAARRKLWGDFREMKWGSAIVDYPAMVLAEDKGDWKFYRQNRNDLVIGPAKLEQITYGFYKDRFYSVSIEAKGKVNCRALRDAVFATYGKGHRQNKAVQKWSWRPGREAPKYVSMSLEYFEGTESSRLVLTYLPSKKRKQADKAKAAKGAAKDF